jgi:outer membrane protein assembly factor BamE (lipoprotein component of BamABCDE complex)
MPVLVREGLSMTLSSRRTRRRLLLVMIATALALTAGVWLAWPRPRSAINRDNAAKIEAGMTVAQVNALLGGPGRDEGGDFTVHYVESSDRVIPDDCNVWLWVSAECGVMVYFRDDRVCHVSVGESTRREESLPAKLRRWLGL